MLTRDDILQSVSAANEEQLASLTRALCHVFV